MARTRRPSQSLPLLRGAAGHNHLGALLSQRLRMSTQGFPPCAIEDQIEAPPNDLD
jgi:hypothetical protein